VEALTGLDDLIAETVADMEEQVSINQLVIRRLMAAS